MTATQAPPTYSSADVCRHTGLTYRQVDNYIRQGYLRVSWVTRDSKPKPWRAGYGPGYDRRFDQDEFDRAQMMAHLVTLGVTAQQAAKVARDPDTLERWVAAVVAAVFPG